IDLVQVIEKQLTPFLDTGVAHKNPGIGQVGAGVLSAPIEPFEKAYEYFAKTAYEGIQKLPQEEKA
ncbi:MAG: hypothetical protein U1C33_04785, partial [Candidatus Cloacimonadaceae bacterium]|nr:hypothetical protein [Candidatus Cloacimonadaceae bacterium]